MSVNDHGFAPSLTSDQREVLLEALDRGYFDVPRRATIGEVAAAVDTTDVEASERLRQGMGTILRENRDGLRERSER
jgi:hypothetical protein